MICALAKRERYIWRVHIKNNWTSEKMLQIIYIISCLSAS